VEKGQLTLVWRLAFTVCCGGLSWITGVVGVVAPGKCRSRAGYVYSGGTCWPGP